MDEDIKITYRPVKEIVILECVSYTLESLMKTVATVIGTGAPIVLNWAEGVVFAVTALPIEEELLEDRLKGTVYWASVAYASMPKYEPHLKASGIEVSIFDVSAHTELRSVAKWLRERSKTESRVAVR